MKVGLPEEWAKLDEERKNQLREIILELRKLGDNSEWPGVAFDQS